MFSHCKLLSLQCENITNWVGALKSAPPTQFVINSTVRDPQTDNAKRKTCLSQNPTHNSGVSRMAYPRDANRGRGFGAPGQMEEWRPSAEVLDGERGLYAMLEVIFSLSDNVIGKGY